MNFTKVSLLLFFYIGIFLIGCRHFQAIRLQDCKIISGLEGPEDFALDTGNGKTRLLVSVQERRARDPNGEVMTGGAIFSLTIGKTGPEEAIRLPIVARDDFPFHPHGISIVQNNREKLLYVINHALTHNHVIETFSVTDEKLIFQQRIRSELLISPNDLIALPDGEIYVTNDHGTTGIMRVFEDLFSLSWSTVVHYRNGYWKIVIEDIALANGIAINREGTRLFVAGLRDKGIFVFSRNPATGKLIEKIQFIYVGSGVDNLLWEDDEWLNVAAHPDLLDFLNHKDNSDYHSASEVYRVNALTGKVQRIFADPGTLIDASSTGLVYLGRLYVSQVFDPEIVSCSVE